MFELIFIFLLLIANGVFSMSEIALLSSRKARLAQMQQEGNRGAKVALKLLENPERFLSTMQVGITLVGVLSGVFGGAALAEQLQPFLEKIPGLAAYAPKVSLVVIVVLITYLSIVIGELVPKGLALRNPEKIASALSVPMAMLSTAASFVVKILEGSTRGILRLLGSSASTQSGPTRDEVRVLVREGLVMGTVEEHESEMVDGVLDLRSSLAEEVMQPKPKVLFLHKAETSAQIWPRVAASQQVVYPVHEGSRDEICGMVSLRDLFTNLANGKNLPLSQLMRPPIFVAENQPALSLLETLRQSSLGAAMVTDEFGTIRGLITLEDLVEEIVGDLRPNDAASDNPTIRALKENEWLCDGMLEIDDLIRQIPHLEEIVERENEPFQTLAGYIVHRLDRLPTEAEAFQAGNFEFEVIDMDRQRIDKVMIRQLASEPVDVSVADN